MTTTILQPGTTISRTKIGIRFENTPQGDIDIPIRSEEAAITLIEALIRTSPILAWDTTTCQPDPAS